MFGIEETKRFTNHFYKVNLDNSEILNIVSYYKYDDLKPIKDIISNYNLSIGDVLIIARMCAIHGVIEYVDNFGRVPNDESFFSSISQFIDNNTLEIFGDSCREEYDLYHFSTDEIFDLLYFIDGLEDNEED